LAGFGPGGEVVVATDHYHEATVVYGDSVLPVLPPNGVSFLQPPGPAIAASGRKCRRSGKPGSGISRKPQRHGRALVRLSLDGTGCRGRFAAFASTGRGTGREKPAARRGSRAGAAASGAAGVKKNGERERKTKRGRDDSLVVCEHGHFGGLGTPLRESYSLSRWVTKLP